MSPLAQSLAYRVSGAGCLTAAMAIIAYRPCALSVVGGLILTVVGLDIIFLPLSRHLRAAAPLAASSQIVANRVDVILGDRTTGVEGLS